MKNQFLVEKYVSKLKHIARTALDKNKQETSMAAISACSAILYHYNQYYTDSEIEDFVGIISQQLIISQNYKAQDNTVLFYDGFGLDLRGWAASFVKAITRENFQLIYVTTKNSEGKIPHILKELKHNKVIYLNMNNFTTHLNELNKIFAEYCPQTAFFYTTPYDVAGAAVFRAYENKVKRIQIDLTDHAFWIGVKSADLFFESRDIGARIAVHERGVKTDNIICLDCAPYINKDICKEPLPFDIRKERYVFSGGALYKTLGDEELLYYKAVREFLCYDCDIKFLYAGTGDDTQLNVLKKEFPNRVYLINERPDFFEIIKHSVFYLNTYPMFGGLMMRYAALAEKLPITLKHDDDADGLLFNQKELGIEFENYSDFIAEIKHIISDDVYREKKEAYMYNSVMNEELFRRNLALLITENKTEFKFDELKPVNTKKFRKEYLERFQKWRNLENIIMWKRHINIWKYFLYLIPKKILHKLKG